jgi:hypothetical protein
MSRYLQDLVMRSLGEVGGLIPRPSNRYETVRQGGAPELTEAIQETEGMNVPLEYGRSFQDASSRTVPPITEAGPTEDIFQPGGQTDAHSRNDPGEGSIEVRKLDQRASSGERFDEVNATKDERAVTARRPMDKTQASRHSGAIRPVNREIPSQEGGSAVAPAPHAKVASPERGGLRTPERAERAESAPRTRNGADDPINKEHLPPLARDQEVSSDPLRPTMGELSFRRVHREGTVPSGGGPPPVVQIRIGRIEVRAVEQPLHAQSKKVVEPQRSSLPLDQYLRRRSREA